MRVRWGGIALCLFVLGNAAQAVVVDTMWLRHMVGDSAKRLNQAAEIKVDTARDAVYVCGSVEDYFTDLRVTEMGLVKYDTAGNYQWRRFYGSSVGSEDDMAHALAIDPTNGNVYIGGYTDNYVPRYRDYSYVRYNTDGGQVWGRKSITSGDDAFYDVALRGNKLYMCGYRYDPTTTQDAYLVARINPSPGAPETLWSRSYVYDATAKYSRRGARRDIHPEFLTMDYSDFDNCATAVAVDPIDGGVVTTGFAYDYANDLYYEWWTMKHDSLGNLLWQRVDHTQNTASVEDDDVAFDVAVDDSGYVYACGFTYWNSHRGYDFAVMKFTPTGGLGYKREYNNNAEDDDDAAFSLCLDDAVPQNLYVTGYIGNPTTGRDVVTMKFVTATMAQVWGDLTIGAQYDGARTAGEDLGYKVHWAAGKVYVAGVKGGSGLSTPPTSDDMLALCYSDASSPGVPKVEDWAWSYDSPDSANTYDDFAAAIFAIDSQNVYVAGQCTRDSSSVGPGHPLWPRFYQSLVTARLFNPERDAAVTAILAPLDTVILGEPVIPRAVVKNLGNAVTTFRSYFSIAGGYADSVLNTALPPGDSAVDSFSVWVPAALGPAVVRCSVAVAGDTVVANDVVVETVFVAVRDVACSLVVAPSGTVDSGATVTPQAWVVNYGNIAEQFDAAMTIGGFYADTVPVTIGAGARSLVAFGAVTLVGRGTWDVACSTRLSGDPNPANDRSTGSVTVRVTDAALLAIEALPDTVDSGAVAAPRLRIANLGTDSAVVRGRLRILHGASVFYEESVDVALAAAEERLVDLVQTAPLAPIGYWQAAARVELASDQVRSNDSIGFGFIVVPVSGIIWPAGWHEVASVPSAPSGRFVKDGAGLSVVELDNNPYIYGLKGYKTSDFYRYDILGNNWIDRAPMPTGIEGKPPYRGAQMNEEVDGSIYAVKGNNTLGFWRYSPPGDSWYQLTDVPLGITRKKVKGGSDLVLRRDADRDYIYLMKGYRNEFYRYDIEAGTWETRASMPIGASIKWYKGSFLVNHGENHIYALKGRYNEFWRYSVAADSWTQVAALPLVNAVGRRKKAKDGASGACYNGSVYALKGGNTTEFWRYDTATNAWVQLIDDSLPSWGSSMRKKRVKAGGDLVYGTGALWALKGNKTLEFWRYGPPFGIAAVRSSERTAQASAAARPVAGAGFALSPNPAARAATVRWFGLKPGAEARVVLYDAAGRAVLQRSIGPGAAGSVQLDVGGLPAGVYVVQLSPGGGQSPDSGRKILIAR